MYTYTYYVYTHTCILSGQTYLGVCSVGGEKEKEHNVREEAFEEVQVSVKRLKGECASIGKSSL